MSLLKPIRIEEYVLEELKNGPKETVNLINEVKDKRPNTTKQAVYTALRKMKVEQIVLSSKKVTALHAIWIQKMRVYLENASQNYSTVQNPGNFLTLEDGDKIRYSFKDSYKTDVFWTHAYYLFLEILEPGEPVYLYNPHELFLLLNPENEIALFEATIKKGFPLLVTTGNTTWLDKKVREYFDGERSQYHTLSRPLFPNNYYINIFGDFLIEVWLDETVSEKIAEFYQRTSEWNTATHKELENIFSQKGPTKLVISKNLKKTKRLKASLRRHFAIKK